MFSIYRGIWADRLEKGQELPFGGHIVGTDLTTRLVLDFDTLEGKFDDFQSPQALHQYYAPNRPAIEGWLAQAGVSFDPYLFFASDIAQRAVQEAMLVTPGRQPGYAERQKKFKDGRANASDLRGIAMCCELAALGQYLLQGALQPGYSVSYMSGVTAQAETGMDIKDHSFLILKDPSSKTYIFDIARPHAGSNLPRILETDVPFTYELFKKAENLLVGATDILTGDRVYYGVGHSMLSQAPNIVGRQ